MTPDRPVHTKSISGFQSKDYRSGLTSTFKTSSIKKETRKQPCDMISKNIEIIKKQAIYPASELIKKQVI